MSYSQNDEELCIVGYFGDRVGRWIDIGAYDGKLFSNTLRLAELGWTGLCVEPDPFAFCKLLETYKDRAGVDLLHAFIGTKQRIVKFYTSGGDGVSTSKESHREKWSDVNYREMYVPVITIRDVLAQFGSSWDFVNLDVEGNNIPVLRDMPLREMGTRLICVEHEGREAEVMKICEAQGLTKQLACNDENLLVGV